MKKYFLSFSILALAIVFAVIVVNRAEAQSNGTSSAVSNLIYPIAELGNCQSQADCKIYCDVAANTAACVDYAKKNNLLAPADLQAAENFLAAGAKGPGGCSGQAECQAYCDDNAHIDECVSYAEANGLMSTQDLQKAKKVQAAIANGIKLPACKNKTDCDSYCAEAAHMQECITFAQNAGLLSGQELQDAQKVLTALEKGVSPLPCQGKDACDTYCAKHMLVTQVHAISPV